MTLALKAFAGLVAVVLLITYLAPVVLKLREPALTIVVLVGFVIALVDLWQSLQSKG